ncbi:CrcB protein [Cyclonatronum proteinivorum]|uniref:Fluoride-specific ion channel FluC n=1 Tax=Cyclonatronum proteinivorum TaxID=1457365 RepID=A0A345UIB2_9BACT|nr:CrcB family protein [Cyclonatronum proteinivorum]AXJ00214.1 CrcB protein [Cyclonatronum proteinivorum]
MSLSPKEMQQPGLFAKIILIFLGGAIGTGLRFALILLSGLEADRIYWIILVENIMGCFALGYVSARLKMRMMRHYAWAPFMGTGLLGSFTTFSAFSTDLIYTAAISWWLTGFYLIFSLTGGLFAAMAGLKLGLSQGRKRWI